MERGVHWGPGGFLGPSEEMADTIFVSNLPEDVSENHLAEHFGAIGLIKVNLVIATVYDA